ncbi:MAG: LysE family translocator [Fusobacteriaceae bacterium]|nr:LysE family translocator [Fusobacteriaceae bacterium]
MIYIVTRSTQFGWKAGIISAIGIDTGTFFYVAASVFGITKILLASDLMFNAVKYCGVAYLIYQGIQSLLEKETSTENRNTVQLSKKKMYLQGLLTNILNPKVALFFIAFLPQFINVSEGNIQEQMIMLGLLFWMIGFFVDIIIALMSGILVQKVVNGKSLFCAKKWIAGIVFIGLGIGTLVC